MKMDSIEEQVRAHKLRATWLRLDRLLAGIGAEIASLAIILLALAVLCAPVGFGLGVTWLLAHWTIRATGTEFLGWILGITVFAFFCRYVWGSRLQAASRRAAEALVAAR
jgi:protein-S-isoprenylcysteine O-methyltransferase Ste14